MVTAQNWKDIENEARRFLMMPDDKREALIVDICNHAQTLKTQVILCLLYLIGMRPEELLRMRKKDFQIQDQDVMILVNTVKNGNPAFPIISKNNLLMKTYILRYIEVIPFDDAKLFQGFNDPTNFNLALSKLSKEFKLKTGVSINLSPYVFRKFRDNWLLQNGASNSDILAWRGTKSLNVIERSYRLTAPISKFKDLIR